MSQVAMAELLRYKECKQNTTGHLDIDHFCLNHKESSKMR
jgi:hypothetical protein